MGELVRDGAALIFVTHNLDQMRAICDRALVLDEGKTTFHGSPADAVGHYLAAVMHRTGELSYTDQPQSVKSAARNITLNFLDQRDESVDLVTTESPLSLRVAFDLDEPIDRLSVETALRRENGQMVLCLNSSQQGVTYAADVGRSVVDVRLPSLPLAAGNYFALVRLWDAGRARLLGETPHKFALQVDDLGKGAGLLALPHEWSRLRRVDKPVPDSITSLIETPVA